LNGFDVYFVLLKYMKKVLERDFIFRMY